METISLTQFCRDNGLAKTTVFRRCQELAIVASKGLTPEDCQTLLKEFGKATAPEFLPGEGSDEITSLTQVTIEPGNHLQALALPIDVQAISLEQFRTDRTRSSLTNRDQFVAGVSSVLDQIEMGMELAEQRQEQELQAVRLAKRQAQQRIEKFRRRADEYRIKTDILASIQNDELDQLGEFTAEVNALGKSRQAGSSPK